MVNELATDGKVANYDMPYWLAVRGDRLEQKAREVIADA